MEPEPPATDRAGGWQEVPLTARDNDRWEAAFTVTELGEYEYTVEAWVDRFGSWLKGLVAKSDAGQDVSSELLEGAEIIQTAASCLKAAPTDSVNFRTTIKTSAAMPSGSDIMAASSMYPAKR